MGFYSTFVVADKVEVDFIVVMLDSMKTFLQQKCRSTPKQQTKRRARRATFGPQMDGSQGYSDDIQMNQKLTD